VEFSVLNGLGTYQGINTWTIVLW